MTPSPGRVLVTGATGFLGGWCVIELRRRGHPVRATVRDAGDTERVRAHLRALLPQAHLDPATLDTLEFVTADLTAEGGWDEAVRECVGVLHVASPFPGRPPRDPDDLLRPARDGTIRVLAAADRAGVRRVVVTSSTSAIAYRSGDGPHDEAQWTDVSHPLGRRAYVRSKTLAERAAWQTAANLRTELTVICPGTMLGPPTTPRLSYSVTPVALMLNGAMPRLPNVGFPVVDVRDIAALHVTALTEPVAAGQRYAAVAGFRWLADIAAVLREGLGDHAEKVPTKTMPDPAVRALSLVQPSLRQILPDLGREQHFDTTKARRDLDWQPRPLDETILDCAHGVLTMRQDRP
ncbi:NAD-dependent epimerase/dehydratase family protein [Asanoa sp. NPDC049518]|uniref:NAD-dependent epimerase/dehydratase family protein n=1 Tax=unclassified Asanoa TaxID=2685164 RepID=UPI003434FAD4